MKQEFFRNSDFKTNRYFTKPQFKDQINEAKKHGKEVFYNEIRKINNNYIARKENGDIYIKDIFNHYWPLFKEKYKSRLSRTGLIESIEKMISCHNFDNGFLFFECPNCNDFYVIGFSCHSRFCPSCGQKYKNKRSIKISEKCLNVPHRQFVFTIPTQLREYFQRYRGLLNVLFSSVNDTLNACLKHTAPIAFKKEHRQLGFVSFLHTFGRDLKFHPHIHLLIAERYINNKGEIKKYDFFSFDFLRITFQNILFHNIYLHCKNVIRNSKLSKEIYFLCKKLKTIYPKGYYFYGPRLNNDDTQIRDTKSLTNYIIRYASHPAISERRILNIDYNTNLITWFYDPHEDDDIKDEELKLGRQIITEDVFSFIKKLIRHIPSKGFQQIRYYGFYSNKFKNKISNNLLFSNAQLNKMLDNTYWRKNLKVSFGYDPTLCKCGSQMLLNYELSYFP